MFKFLHIADVHFGAPLTSKDFKLGQDLKSAQKNAFKRAVDRCLGEAVDGLIIAGDLFDNERVALDIEKFLHEQFERLEEAGIQVFYAPGNHDPIITLPFRFGDNVVVFDRDVPQEAVLENASGQICRVMGIAHLSETEKRNLIRQFPARQDGAVHVGIAHAMVESVEAGPEKGQYLPTSISDLERTGYDYWALGHIHQRLQIKDLPIHYSGTIQGLDINESGPKGGNLVTLDNGQVDVTFVPLSAMQFGQMGLDVSGEYESELEFYQALRHTLKERVEAIGAQPAELVLRVTLSGQTDMVRYLKVQENIQYLEDELAKDLELRALEIRKGSLVGLMDLEGLVKENPVMEEILALLDDPGTDPRFIEALEALTLKSEEGERPAAEIIRDNREKLQELLMIYFMGDMS